MTIFYTLPCPAPPSLPPSLPPFRHNMSLKHVMMAADASNKLVSVCEGGPGTVKMPRTLQLVKQLKKELNVQKIVKEEKNFRKKANCEWSCRKEGGADANMERGCCRLGEG